MAHGAARAGVTAQSPRHLPNGKRLVRRNPGKRARIVACLQMHRRWACRAGANAQARTRDAIGLDGRTVVPGTQSLASCRCHARTIAGSAGPVTGRLRHKLPHAVTSHRPMREMVWTVGVVSQQPLFSTRSGAPGHTLDHPFGRGDQCQRLLLQRRN